MDSNTAVDEMSRSLPDSAGTRPGDDDARRTDTMIKVNSRISEISERLLLIDKAVVGSLVDIIAQHPLGEAVTVLSSYRDQVERLETAVKELKSRLSYACEVAMPARMDEEQCKTFNTDDLRVTRTAKTYASIIEQESAFAWLRGHGLEALIKETVNSSSLSATAKELMSNGEELPEDLFRVHIKDNISITKKAKS